MKFLLDENVDHPLASFLSSLDHDVTSIAFDYTKSIKDTDVLSIARKEKRILITNDLDFGELIFRQHLPHRGVILFRLGKENLATKKRWLLIVLEKYQSQLQHFIVVTDHGIRIRRIAKN